MPLAYLTPEADRLLQGGTGGEPEELNNRNEEEPRNSWADTSQCQYYVGLQDQSSVPAPGMPLYKTNPHLAKLQLYRPGAVSWQGEIQRCTHSYPASMKSKCTCCLGAMLPGDCELQAFCVETWPAHRSSARMLNTELSEKHKIQVLLHERRWQQMD